MGTMHAVLVALLVHYLTVNSQEVLAPDCASLSDGLFGQDCSEWVTVCKAGSPQLARCPSGLLFSASSSACTTFSQEECLAGDLPPLPDGSSCDEGSGLDPVDFCSSSFSVCIDSSLHHLSCPPGLLFSPSSSFCSASPVECLSSEWRGMPSSRFTRSSLPTCDSLGDGFHSLGCSSSFFNCAKGVARIMQCPNGLIFDGHKTACKNEEDVHVCVSTEASGEGSGEASGEASGEGSAEDVEAVKETLLVEETIQVEGSGEASGEGSGEGSGDGSGEIVEQILTEDKKVPSMVESSGEGSGQGEESSGEASGVEGSGEVEEINGEEASGEASGDEQSGEGSGVEDFCSARVDGFYRSGDCSTSFTGCSGGVTWQMGCPAQLIFDQERQLCDYPGNFPSCSSGNETASDSDSECSGEILMTDSATTVSSLSESTTAKPPSLPASTTTSTESPAVPSSPSSMAESSSSNRGAMIPPSTESPSPSFTPSSSSPLVSSSREQHIAQNTTRGAVNCSALSDGFYSTAECASSFIGCSGGVTWQMGCPAQLIFDQEHQLCDYPGNLAACSSSADNESTTNSNGEKSQNSESATTSSALLDSTEVTASSSASLLAPSPSPSPLPDSSSAPTVSPPSDSTTAEPVNPSSASSLSSSSSAEEQIARSSSLDEVMKCSSRPDGFYRSSECSSSFIGCSGGVTSQMECPAHLFFNEHNQLCDFPGNMEACSAADSAALPSESSTLSSLPPSTSPSISVSSPSTPSAVSATVATSASSDTLAVEKCSSRGDGFFSLGCRSEFLACVSGSASLMNCPADLVYDESRQMCQVAVQVAACGEGLLAADSSSPATVSIQSSASAPVECSADGVSASSPCSDFFTRCLSGRSLQFFCTEGFLFDSTAASCVPASSLPHCTTQ